MKIFRIILAFSLVYMATSLKAQTISISPIKVDTTDLLVDSIIKSSVQKDINVLVLNETSAFVKKATYAGSSFPPAKMPNGYRKSADVSVHIPTYKIYSSPDLSNEKKSLPLVLEKGITVK
jgi:hypothetical protein